MLALCLRLSSAGSELCYFAARQESNFPSVIVTRTFFRPGLKPEELKLVWNAYLAFERSRMHVLRSLDVQYRMQSSVSLILVLFFVPHNYKFIICLRSLTATALWSTFLSFSELICE
jgi:hypothetical protein